MPPERGMLGLTPQWFRAGVGVAADRVRPAGRGIPVGGTPSDHPTSLVPACDPVAARSERVVRPHRMFRPTGRRTLTTSHASLVRSKSASVERRLQSLLSVRDAHIGQCANAAWLLTASKASLASSSEMLDCPYQTVPPMLERLAA